MPRNRARVSSASPPAPPNPEAAYGGSPEAFRQPNDPLVGKPIGGVIVFGGGLPLYERHGTVVDGLGVSGDTSCADHVVAWKVRHALNLDAVPVGVAPHVTDNLILDLQDGVSVSGFGHPTCKGGTPSDELIKALPERFPTGPKE
jgi:Haem-degrading